jgi:iron(III) transport system ATP-binding protein
VDVVGKGWQGTVEADAALKTDEPVTVVVRPENIVLGPGPDGTIRWKGKVTHSIFRGARRSLTVRTEHDTLHVEAPALSKVSVGDEVELSVAKGGAFAIKPS